MTSFYLIKPLLFAAFWTLCLPFCNAYAVLSHEAIIDETWEDYIRPLLLLKYPTSTEEQLSEAHGFLYGGAVLPDMGYFPFGSSLFSDLVHYVRSGDFVNNMLEEAQNLNEYAFALGYLSHYMADCYGHPLGTNKAVPYLFPCAMRKYGPVVNYEQAEKYHVRAEFSFDVYQVASGNYGPDDYHDFVGFMLSQPLLERAFKKTYGLEIGDIFTSFSIAESIFRFSIRKVLPAITNASARLKSSSGEGNTSVYRYKADRKKYNSEFGKPSTKTMGLAFFILILPKIGPLSILRSKNIDENVAKIFQESFAEIIKQYKASLLQLHSKKPAFVNINWDTGEQTEPGDYELADLAYYELLLELEKTDFKHVSDKLKNNITSYYSDKEKLHKSCRKKRKWRKASEALQALENSWQPTVPNG